MFRGHPFRRNLFWEFHYLNLHSRILSVFTARTTRRINVNFQWLVNEVMDLIVILPKITTGFEELNEI